MTCPGDDKVAVLIVRNPVEQMQGEFVCTSFERTDIYFNRAIKSKTRDFTFKTLHLLVQD